MGCKIALVMPPVCVFAPLYPMGLGYLAESLRRDGHEVSIFNYSIDHSMRNYSRDKAIAELKAYKPDLIGFTVYTVSYLEVKRMIADINREIPQSKVMVGGPHISALPEFSLKDLSADFSVAGEGEYIVLDIAKSLKTNQLKDVIGISFYDNGEIISYPGCNVIYDLDNLSSTFRDLIPPNEYSDFGGGIWSKRVNGAALITSRGCPHKCTFCVNRYITGGKYRKRCKYKVVEEIEFLMENYGVQEVSLYDATFSEDRDHAIGICEEIIAKRLDIAWSPIVGIRIDTVDNEMLQAFKQAGCYQLSFGIESGSKDVLDSLEKPVDRAGIVEKIAMVKSYGIETRGFFIMGSPADTEKSIKETIRFSRKSGLDFVAFTHALPLPGNNFFYEKYTKLDWPFIDWDKFYLFSNDPINLSNVSNTKLKLFFLVGFFWFYLRWQPIKRLVTFFLRGQLKTLKTVKFIYCIIKDLF